MEVLKVIEDAQSGRALANLAARFNIDEQQARAAAAAVLPELALALERNSLSRGGLADLVSALGDGHHEAILDRPQDWNDPRVEADGQAILDHILGGPSKARSLAARSSQSTGLSGTLIAALLPILAQMLMGALSRYMKGGLGDVLSRLPAPNANSRGGGRNADDPMSGRNRSGGPIPGGFELPRTVDSGTGGFPLPPLPPNPDDASGGPVPANAGIPFPVPGGSRDNPYGDVSDILRRRGATVSTGSGSSGSLWSIVRNVLGSALGFGGSGFFGWVVRLLVMRLGWPILRRIVLGR